MALVTVVVPTYDRIDYLTQALNSLVQQTFKDFVVVIADDCGPNDLRPIVDSLHDDRFTLVRRSSNLGVAANVNGVLATATTKYTSILNDDDLWEPTFLEVIVSGLEEHSTACLGFCDLTIIDSENKVMVSETREISHSSGRASLKEGFHQPFIGPCLMHGTPAVAMACVMRHSMVDWSYLPNEVGSYYDDWLGYIALKHGQGVWYTSQKLSRYRIHAGMETNAVAFSEEARLRQRLQTEFITRTKLADDKLAEFHPFLLRQHKQALLGAVNSASILGSKETVKARIQQSQHLHSKVFMDMLKISLMLPSKVADVALYTKRHFLQRETEIERAS
jgi:glycosyltransferase involved in cell wall biosynthesis